MERYDEAVNPYRAHELRRPTLELASNRARLLKIAGGLLVIAASVGIFLLCAASNIGLVFIGPFAFGGVLIAQARSAAIELRPEERSGEVVVRRLFRTERTTFAFADVVGTKVERVMLGGRPADWELRLAQKSAPDIPLVRGDDDEIDAALAKLDAFLAEHELTR
jgi:hypothetical protein